MRATCGDNSPGCSQRWNSIPVSLLPFSRKETNKKERPPCERRPFAPQTPYLENQLHGQLNLTRGTEIARREPRTAGDHAERRGRCSDKSCSCSAGGSGKRCNRIGEVDLVQGIERIEAHLEPKA